MESNVSSSTTFENISFSNKLKHVYIKKAEIREAITFKSSPSIFPENIYSQSGLFKKCCIDCCTNSTIYYDAKNKSHHLIDLFKSPSSYISDEKKSLRWLNKNLFYQFDCQLNISLNIYQNKILNNLNAKNMIGESKIVEQKIIRFLKQLQPMSLFFSKKAIKGTLIVINQLLKLFFSKILCYQIHLSSLRTAHCKRLSIVYVLDSECTFIDQLIVQLTLFLNNFKISNLILPLNDNQKSHKIFKCLQSLMNISLVNNDYLLKYKQNSSKISGRPSENDDTVIYRQVLTQYLVELFKNETDIMIQSNSFNIDIVTELVENESIHDVLIVPVTVSYESLALSKSLETLPKSIFKLVTKLTKMILMRLFNDQNNGQVRVNFGQPFSLSEFIENNKNKTYLKYAQTNLKLKRHLNYDIHQSETVMCTNIVAFILVTFYPKGCNASQLCHKFLDIKNLLAYNFQIGFNYNSVQDVIKYSIDLLKDFINIEKSPESCHDNMKNIYLKPKDGNTIRELFLYGRKISKILFLNSVIANSVNKNLKNDLHHVNFEFTSSHLDVNENDLIEKCFQLLNIFQYEFDMYKKPCESVFSRLHINLSEFINSEILIDQYAKKHDERFNRLSQSYRRQYEDDWDSDEEQNGYYNRKNESSKSSEKEDFNPDEEEISQWKPAKNPKYFTVNREKNSKLMFFCKILQPYIEGYLRFLMVIQNIDPEKMFTEQEIISIIQDETHDLEAKGLINYAESTCVSMIKGAIQFCVSTKILDKIWHLDDTKENELYYYALNNRHKKILHKNYKILKSFQSI